MPTVQTSGVKAADPGLGFTLNFSEPVNDTIKTVITLQDLQQSTKTYGTEVTLSNKVSDQNLVFVVPFGDNQYAPSNCLSFQIDVYVPNNASAPLQSLNGYVFGESGVFDYHTSVPTTILGLPQTGNMLQSDDGKFVGIYQTDGNFCVYPQFVNGKGQGMPPVYTTNSAVGQPTSFQLVILGGNGKGMAQILIQNGGQLDSASNPFPYKQGNMMYMSINSSGTLCLNGFPLIFNKA